MELLSSLRRACDRIDRLADESLQQQDAALWIMIAISIVDAFVSAYFRVLVEESRKYAFAKDEVLRSLANRASLDSKIRKWPKLLFGKEIRFDSGPGQMFMKLKDLGNQLVHFPSSWETVELPGPVYINGMEEAGLGLQITVQMSSQEPSNHQFHATSRAGA